MQAESEVFSRPNEQAVSYNLTQFTFWCNTPVNGKRSTARLLFGERNGAPRISVFTGLDNIKFIWMGFDPLTFEMFLSKLEHVARSKEPTSDFIQNMEKAKDSNDYTVRNTLHFGKSEDGIVYLEVEERGVRITFKMEPPVWHKFQRSDGQPMSNSEFSALRAISLVNVLRRVYGNWSSRIIPMNKDAGAKKFNKNNTGNEQKAVTSSESFNDNDFMY